MKFLAHSMVAAVFLAASFLNCPAFETVGPPGGEAAGVAAASGRGGKESWHIRPVADRPTDAAGESELDAIFATAASAAKVAPAGAAGAAHKKATTARLTADLETFVANHPDSAWTPGTHLALGRTATLRSGYISATAHYRQAWDSVVGQTNRMAREMAAEAGGSLAKLLILTGRLGEYDALLEQALATGQTPTFGTDWQWAGELRAWARKHPTEAYKCGLYCLDQLGRMTQSGQFRPKDITETDASTNGFTAAELVQLGTKVGLRVHAAILPSGEDVPVPCIVHLQADHFIVVREKRGDFYGVYDTVAFGPRWLTRAELTAEASGCVIVSDASVDPQAVALPRMTLETAAGYRGRCHAPLPYDHDDSPCDPPPDGCCPPGGPGGGPGGGPPGRGGSPGRGGGSGHGNGPSQSPGNKPDPSQGGPVNIVKGDNIGGSSGGCGCKGGGGMPFWFISEPFLTLWVQDEPLDYQPAFGPAVNLKLSYHTRASQSVVTSARWEGATMGASGLSGIWSASWLSFAELDVTDAIVDLALPAGGWATFTFPASSNISDVNYRNNLWISKTITSGSVTAIVLHYQDGSTITYGVVDNSSPAWGGIFYMSKRADAMGNAVNFAYDSNYYLTNVVAADGASFTVHHDNMSFPEVITSVSTSYGASVAFGYDSNPKLTSITDAAGITSTVAYDTLWGQTLNTITTPYGTTTFDTAHNFTGSLTGMFDRVARITLPDGSQEFHAQLNTYSGLDWPDFGAGQIPTNTPLNTLDTDTGGRQERNTFYWNAQQFAPYASTALTDFTWTAFKAATIKHWLAATDPSYTHYDSLSLQQSPSPDGTTEGQIVWYDYAGKPVGVDYERGIQVMPTVVAQVMPDGTTWYQNRTYTTNGLLTKVIEKWAVGATAYYRTNTFGYATNGIDLVVTTNALGVQVVSNVFNAYHRIATNYDALNQATTITYDATTQLPTSTTDPAGLTTTNLYDGTTHRLKQVIALGISRTNGFSWNPDGTVLGETNELGLTVTNYWDGLHRLTGMLFPDGTTTTNLYYLLTNNVFTGGTGNTNLLDLTASRDRLGHWTYYGYDALRRLIAETNANGVATGYGYCDCGALTSVTNAYGTAVQAITQYVYDSEPRLIQTIRPDNSVVTNSLDALGRVSVQGDAFGQITNTFDNLNRLVAVSNYFGRVQTAANDAANQATNRVDANGVILNTTFDNLGRTRTVSYPDGGVESFGYSALGLVKYTNQLGQVTSYGYDVARRKTAETNANLEVTSFAYDAASDLLTLTDAKNQTTTWHYDIYGSVSNKVDAAGNIILVYHYDADLRLTNRWSFTKGNTYYSYDLLGNLTNITYPVSPAIRLRYDALNRVTNMIDAVGTTVYSYDVAGHMLSEDGPWNDDTVSYTYIAGKRVSLALLQPTASPWVQTYAYDSAKRLTNTISPAGAFTYAYGATNHLLVAELLEPNGAYITNTYDTVARLTGTFLNNSTNGTLNGHQYKYNQGNQRTQQVFTAGNYENYGYDNIGQLTSAFGSESGGATNRLQEQFGYNYDAAHNLAYRTNNALVQNFMVNTLNELSSAGRSGTLTVAGGTTAKATNVTINTLAATQYRDNTFARAGFTVTNGNNAFTAAAADTLGRSAMQTITANLPATVSYTYDGNGNLLTDGYRTFTYDDENQLLSVIVTNGVGNSAMSTNIYDGRLRRRVRIDYTWASGVWLPTNQVYYIYDGNLVIQERFQSNHSDMSLTRGLDLAGTLQGSDGIGGLIARTDSSSRSHYFHCDGNGNITLLIDAWQHGAASYLYDSFGNIIFQGGPLSEINAFRYASKEVDIVSALVNYTYRFYDPASQRWLNRDPLGESSDIHMFGFCFNDPINFRDLSGLYTEPNCQAQRQAVRDAQSNVNKDKRSARNSFRHAAMDIEAMGFSIGAGSCAVYLGARSGTAAGGVVAVVGGVLGLAGSVVTMHFAYQDMDEAQQSMNDLKVDLKVWNSAKQALKDCEKAAKNPKQPNFPQAPVPFPGGVDPR